MMYSPFLYAESLNSQRMGFVMNILLDQNQTSAAYGKSCTEEIDTM